MSRDMLAALAHDGDLEASLKGLDKLLNLERRLALLVFKHLTHLTVCY